jgi:hypothetical protein
MRKFTFSGLMMLFAVLSIHLQASNPVISLSAEPTNSQVLSSDQNGTQLQFHFGDINTINVKTEKGVFTELRMPGAYWTNRVGEPKLPAQRKLIAIPFGAEVKVSVNSFNVSTIDLSSKGIENQLMPLQYDIPKNMDVAEIPFEYNAEAYAAKSFNESEMAKVEVLGTMRGVRIARVTVEPVRYNPSTNQLEVYNDIEVGLSYENADWALTEQTYKGTYSPYWDITYSPLMNVDDVYDDHPDLLTYPVHMLIISDPMFEETLQPFIEWKTKSGFYLNVVYTDEIGSSVSEIQTWISDQYDEGLANGHAPDFVLFVGDVQQIPASATGSASGKKTDLYYCSVDGDYFPEMYYGRMSAQNVGQLQNYLDKILPYEKYEMEDPTYLDDVTLIAGADGSWNPAVGQPTVLYGTENYFNVDHGYDDIWVYLNSYSGCYDNERISVSFINYTAHCSETSWGDPYLGISDAYAMENVGKYPLAIGNCCLAADFGYNESMSEAWMRAGGDRGAVGYIGSSPSSYWFEDFYWSVGAFPISGNNNGYVPSFEETTMGAYDGAWGESYFCQDALVFVGNLAVTEVDIQGYAQHSSPTYYWQAYNTLGDPSLLPYHTQGSENSVNHMDILPIGVAEYEVSAEPGSYVAISKGGVLHGTAYIGESGSVMVELEPITEAGDVDIVVTRQQYIPYMVTVPAAALEGPFLTISEFVFDNGAEAVNYGSNAGMDVNLTNLGTATANDVTITVTVDDDYCALTSAASVSAGVINPDETITIEDAFTFAISDEAPDMHMVTISVSIEGTAKEVWEQDINFYIYAPVPEFGSFVIDDSNGGNSNGRIDPGETVDVVIETWNNGHAASLDGSVIVSSSSSYLTVNTTNIEVAPIDAEAYADVTFSVTADESTPIGTVVDMNLDYIAGNYTTSIMLQQAVGLILEDFETGDFSMFDWQFDSNPWEIVGADQAYEGEYAARSKDITDNQVSTMYLNYNVAAAGELSFMYKVSSEGGYDFLRFYVNGSVVGEWAGEVAWSEFTYEMEAGEYELKWEYDKDGTVSSGEDCAWVDFIVFPASGDNTLIAAFDVDNNNPCDGESVNFTSNSLGEISEWNWTFEGGIPETSTDENPSVTYETPGTYSVTLEVGDGVQTATITKDDYIIVHNCTGLNEISANVNIYPNPNTGVFFMDLQGMETADIKIYNAVGTLVYEESDYANDNSMKRIDLSHEAEGVYMLIIENDDQRMIEKIIVK